MNSRKLSAWDLIDEVLTNMNDINFQVWSEDRLGFRDALIEEIKLYILEEDVLISQEQPENEGE
jgi:hypothetical protein